MPNIGTAPLDPSTEVGKLRVLLRDTEFVPLVPPQDGLGDYSVYSDIDLAIYLAEAKGNLNIAAGRAIRSLAMSYAAIGKSIKTDDLSIDLKSRGGDLLAVAQSYLDDAAEADKAEAADFLQLVPFGGRLGRKGRVRPEATPWPLWR